MKEKDLVVEYLIYGTDFYGTNGCPIYIFGRGSFEQ